MTIIALREADPDRFADRLEDHLRRAWEVFAAPVFAGREWVCLLRREDAQVLASTAQFNQENHTGFSSSIVVEEDGRRLYDGGGHTRLEEEEFIALAVKAGWLP